MSEEQKQDDFIGKTIKHYTLLELIGQGTSTRVYAADDSSNGSKVSVKLFLHHDGAVELFERNTEVLSHLKHPNIVAILDYGEFDNITYNVMPLLSGGSVDKLIEAGTLTASEIVKILQQVSDALTYAHEKNIVHNNLKPSNILLDDAGNACLTGFGVPKYLEANEITSVGAVIGTPAYMSPEQVQGQKVDKRGDIFSLGITAYELFAGHHPFHEEKNYIRLMMKMIKDDLPPLKNDNLDADLVNKLDAIIQKAAAKSPDARYASVAEFNVALEAVFS